MTSDEDEIQITTGDVVAWAKNYKGEKFHAILTDPPYHLTTIVKRFGKPDSAPAKDRDGLFKRASRGFMGQTWDGGDVAHDPDTWYALGEHLHDGGFGMAFASSRGWHRLAVAIEDAGFIIHPTIFMFGWVYGQGFPKAHRIDNQIDDESLSETWEGHRYGLQALKPALEPIIVFQKPYTGKPVEQMVETGAGALNIYDTLVGQEILPPVERGVSKIGTFEGADGNVTPEREGRWPANFILVHHPDCEKIGMVKDQYVRNRFTEDWLAFGGGVGVEYESNEASGNVILYNCVDGCPVKILNEQSGVSKSNFNPKPSEAPGGNTWGGSFQTNRGARGYDDSGGAARYFHQSTWQQEVLEQLELADKIGYFSKASPTERNEGLSHMEKFFLKTMGDGIGEREHNEEENSAWVNNPHPTLKPIDLSRYLAKMLLPPDLYAPRRILVPFAGVASEVIGAWQAGWEQIVGIEKVEKYAVIARERVDYWVNRRGHQLSLFE